MLLKYLCSLFIAYRYFATEWPLAFFLGGGGGKNQHCQQCQQTCGIWHDVNNGLYWIGLCSVLRPLQHSIGYMRDGFYRSKDPTNSIKVLKEMLQKRKKTTKTT